MYTRCLCLIWGAKVPLVTLLHLTRREVLAFARSTTYCTRILEKLLIKQMCTRGIETNVIIVLISTYKVVRKLFC